MSLLLQTGKIVKMTNFLVWFTIFGMIPQYGDCDKFLIMHPFYSGSHVLTLHHVAESLVNRGHQVIKLDILFPLFIMELVIFFYELCTFLMIVVIELLLDVLLV